MGIEQIKDDLNKVKLDIVKIDCSNDRLDEHYEDLKVELAELESRIMKIERRLTQSNAIKKMLFSIVATAAIVLPVIDLARHYVN
jgi:predicted  nucleic acid-binding Zn-ribbon protein